MMAVSVDCSVYAEVGKSPSHAVTTQENTASKMFADCYKQAVNDALDEQPSLLITTETDNEKDVEEKSAKKMSEEEAAALLMLFLFSQQMSASTAPLDTNADASEKDEQAHSTESTSALSNSEKSRSGSSLMPAQENVEEEVIATPEAKTKVVPNNPEVKAPFENSTVPADKGLDTETVKTPSPSASALPSALPLPKEDKRQPAFSPSENAPLSRLSPSSHVAPPIASQSVLPSTEAQIAALPLRGTQFSEMLSQRVMWLSSQNLQSAQIELSPKELGTLEVRVALAAGGAEVQLSSQHAEVRNVLEGQIYRLQEMLETQGLPAPRVGIFDSSLAQQHKEQGGRASRPAKQQVTENEENVIIQPARQQALIDYYA